MDFVGKVAIVTGGGRGIGGSCAQELLKRGCKVSILEINEQTGKNFVDNLSDEEKKRTLYLNCDVASMDSFRAAFEKVVETFGGIDIVVNNAGVMNEIDWMKCVSVNFIGTINGTKLAFEYMGTDSKGKGGRIINMISEAGLKSFGAIPVYCATKHGLIGFTKSYGDDYHFKKTHVTVNGICPAAVNTVLLQTAKPFTLDPEGTTEKIASYVLMSPTVIGEALIQLLNENRNGALLHVEGQNNMTYVSTKHETEKLQFES